LIVVEQKMDRVVELLGATETDVKPQRGRRRSTKRSGRGI
jgi:hypothetical protein